MFLNGDEANCGNMAISELCNVFELGCAFRLNSANCPKIKHEELDKFNLSEIFQNVTEQEQIGEVLSNLMRQRVKIRKHMKESNSI